MMIRKDEIHLSDVIGSCTSALCDMRDTFQKARKEGRKERTKHSERHPKVLRLSHISQRNQIIWNMFVFARTASHCSLTSIT